MYDPNMASVYPKEINGKTYYYLREMARVDGKPKMVSERYLGSAADIEGVRLCCSDYAAARGMTLLA